MPCDRARESYAQRAWEQAYRAFRLADEAAPLASEDLECLATSAYLTGRDGEFLRAYERAHRAHVSAGAPARAARCAFWLGLALLLRGEAGQASGWLARAQRLVEDIECAEKGLLLLPDAERQLQSGDFAGAYAAAAAAAQLGERFAELDLLACARHLQGRSLLHQGRIAAGLALLDEAMVAVTAGELSPVMAGLLYCSVIQACQQFYALERAREWTAALSRWCETQPEMVAFTGTCLVHRAEILQLRGAWREAIEEAHRACRRFASAADPAPAGTAFYQEAEVHRLRGDFRAAEAAYRAASRAGYDPQPGLALLRLAQGRVETAVAAIKRVVAMASGRSQRVGLLPAYVEILLAAGDTAEARSASGALDEAARDFDSRVLAAAAAEAAGAVALADQDPAAALARLRVALDTWQRADAPYRVARVRMLIGLACRALGDNEGSQLELDAARAAFSRLGAAADVARTDLLREDGASSDFHRLSPRELQVLRLVAAGKTNKAIACELGLSEKTIDRHVSNIFTKLDVSSRAAATAYAYQHDLV